MGINVDMSGMKTDGNVSMFENAKLDNPEVKIKAKGTKIGGKLTIGNNTKGSLKLDAEIENTSAGSVSIADGAENARVAVEIKNVHTRSGITIKGKPYDATAPKDTVFGDTVSDDTRSAGSEDARYSQQFSYNIYRHGYRTTTSHPENTKGKPSFFEAILDWLDNMLNPDRGPDRDN